MNRFQMKTALLLVVYFGFALGTSYDPIPTCSDGENDLEEGDVFEEPGTCNLCTCVPIEDGPGLQARCEERACPEPIHDCYANGIQYEAGDHYMANDGCNTCTCIELGGGHEVPACTAMACPEINLCTAFGETFEEGELYDSDDECNTCVCIRTTHGILRPACTHNFCHEPDLKRAAKQPVNRCVVNGRTYGLGRHYVGADGHSQCVCVETPQGELIPACTNTVCRRRRQEDDTACVANGNTYKPGDSYKADDGCNTCMCMEARNGDIIGACTRIGCDIQPPTDLPLVRRAGKPFRRTEDETSNDVEGEEEEIPCTANGVTYQPGDSYTDDDGCNSCMCVEVPNGDIVGACTRMACNFPPPTDLPVVRRAGKPVRRTEDETSDDEEEEDQCTVNGVRYEPGDTFTAADGCNNCFCGLNAEGDRVAGCTMMACPPGCFVGGLYYPLRASYPAEDGCNTCTCVEQGQSTCTEMACTTDG